MAQESDSHFLGGIIKEMLQNNKKTMSIINELTTHVETMEQRILKLELTNK